MNDMDKKLVSEARERAEKASDSGAAFGWFDERGESVKHVLALCDLAERQAKAISRQAEREGYVLKGIVKAFALAGMNVPHDPFYRGPVYLGDQLGKALGEIERLRAENARVAPIVQAYRELLPLAIDAATQLEEYEQPMPQWSNAYRELDGWIRSNEVEPLDDSPKGAAT